MNDSIAITNDNFVTLMDQGFAQTVKGRPDIAVALSGGPDSLVLAFLLNHWSKKTNGPHIHALTVDHGLRSGSGEEARKVADWAKTQEGLHHEILSWEEDKPDTRLQEEARNARYDLMGAYCQEKGIRHLFLAHHMDDQAETLLLRLAGGSGLDGLAGMQPATPHKAGMILLRPFLGVSKERLIATCEVENLPFIQDPSNDSEDFARVRLRKSREALEEEGLTNARLATTATRLSRARQALEEIAEMALRDIMTEEKADQVTLSAKVLCVWPEDIGLRVLLKSMAILRPAEPYNPRLDKVEALFTDLTAPTPFRTRTLGGLIISRDDQAGAITLRKEEG